MKISFLNVGYGDSILIEDECGGEKFIMLVDGGKPDGDHYTGYPHRIRAADFLKESGMDRINLLVVTHLHEDHTGGLPEVINQVAVDELWTNLILPPEFQGLEEGTVSELHGGARRLADSLRRHDELCGILTSRGTVIKKVRGWEFNRRVHEDFYIDILGPHADDAARLGKFVNSMSCAKDAVQWNEILEQMDCFINDTSIILKLVYFNKRIILGGDAGLSCWERLIDASIPLGADIFKLPHHGHAGSASAEMMEKINPEFIVTSVSNDRPGHCPNDAVFEMLYRQARKNQREVGFLFTDAVDMQPYSNNEMKHKAIVFMIGHDMVKLESCT
jgi:hypothetical protein